MKWRISSSSQGSCFVRNFHPSDFCTALKWLVSSFIHRRRRSGASQSLASWSTSTTFSIVNRWTRPLMHFCFNCGTLYTWDSASRWIPYLSISSSVHLQQIKDILVISYCWWQRHLSVCLISQRIYRITICIVGIYKPGWVKEADESGYGCWRNTVDFDYSFGASLFTRLF
jgi:hypothetical protein